MVAENSHAKFPLVRQLAQQTVRRCRQFRLSVPSQSTEELDDPAPAAVVDMADDSDNDDAMDAEDDDDDDDNDDDVSDDDY